FSACRGLAMRCSSQLTIHNGSSSPTWSATAPFPELAIFSRLQSTPPPVTALREPPTLRRSGSDFLSRCRNSIAHRDAEPTAIKAGQMGFPHQRQIENDYGRMDRDTTCFALTDC